MGLSATPDGSREWRVVAASVVGVRHEMVGQPCQDAHQCRKLSNGLLVMALGDGAGSAALAEFGSSAAVTAAVEWISGSVSESGHLAMSDEEWKLLLTDALRASLMAIEKEAATRQVSPRDMATTLIVLVATQSLVAAAQIGDGAALVSSETNELFSLTRPSAGEYINETTFLVSPDAIDSAQLKVWRGCTRGVAAFSDGLQMLALRMPDNTPHAPFFLPLFRFADAVIDTAEGENQLRAFLHSPRIAQRTDDDLTLVLAVLPR